VSLAAPNIMGDLLGAGRSVSFIINRVEGAAFVNAQGSTNVTNPKVADNNSPLPQDRLYFRYNFFHDALSVTGLSSAPPIFDPTIQGFKVGTATKLYDVNAYTFGAEKTFCDRLLSVEVRVPFSTTLASRLDLSTGTVTGTQSLTLGQILAARPGLPPGQIGGRPPPGPDPQVIDVAPTPGNTLGRQDTEFGDMSVILKALLVEHRCWAVSGGLSVGIPTGNDTNVRVVDYLGDVRLNIDTVQRVRDFHIDNSTWSLSPFLAVLAAPSDRFFIQGFTQVDVPLNRSDVVYTETAPIVFTPFPTVPGTVVPPFTVHERIAEQTLLHVDIGTGYWLLHRQRPAWITGVAPTLELHYTTTLENADIVTLPRDPTFLVTAAGLQTPPPPQVGNRRNRLDLLDLTVGTTVELSGGSTLAAGFAFPLRGGDDRVFDWEFLLQLNYRFGPRGL
jgi:hypothetical protein